MSSLTTSSRCLPTLLLTSAMLGCTATEKTVVPAPLAHEPSSDKQIVSGVGIRGCYIGMSASKLSAEWKKLPRTSLNTTLDTDVYQSSNRGIRAGVKDGSVFGVTFIYDRTQYPELNRVYSGKTYEGMDGKSTVVDVINRYGQPVYMAKVGPAPTVRLDYEDLGILFTFSGPRLESVAINTPDPTYDPKTDSDLGDVTEYRAIVPRKTRDETATGP